MSNKAESASQLPDSVKQVVDQALKAQQRIVLATGVFDILHQEHQVFLQKAKAAGDILIVGVESDARVRALKGEGRPVNLEANRARSLEKLQLADVVFILPEEFTKPEHFRALLMHIRPSVLAVSSHSPHLEHKQALMQEIGGQVQVVHQHNPQISTTQILAQRS